jgi:hypothetical protein
VIHNEKNDEMKKEEVKEIKGRMKWWKMKRGAMMEAFTREGCWYPRKCCVE